MIDEKSWKEFRDSGMLWLINTTLQLFGWSIVVEMNDNNEFVRAYPARVKFRGFSSDHNTEGYVQVTEYMNKESKVLLKEAKD